MLPLFINVVQAPHHVEHAPHVGLRTAMALVVALLLHSFVSFKRHIMWNMLGM